MKIAFILPWYGENIIGGAELECRYTALNLQRMGVKVEILTTCVKNFYSPWDSNYYKEGEYNIEGLVVRRFNVKKRDRKTFHLLNQKIMIASSYYSYQNFSSHYKPHSPLSASEEEKYIDEMINSLSLYKYIYNNKREYDYFLFIPYLFSTAYFGSAIWSEKSVLIPCLHNSEINAYLKIYRTMFENVNKIVFHTSSEESLALRLYGLKDVDKKTIGEGVNQFYYSGDRFKKKYSIDFPFILYVGRKSTGKNVPLLLNYFYRYRDNNPRYDLRLLLIGDGEVNIDERYKEHIIDMGTVSDEDKYDAYAAAVCLCQPSVRESFSLVVMESWLAERPVLVHGYCDVTSNHCQQSDGGLYFVDFSEFEMCVRYLLENNYISMQMGKNGRDYVLKNYSWDKITKDYIDFLKN